MNTSHVRVERGLQISMSALVWLGTLMLGMGQDSSLIPIVSLVACISAFYLTDLKGWLQLNHRQANLAGLATVAICFWELRRVHVEAQVLTLANLLFYLQCVNLFRRKEPRIYWMLALLSVLEVAVAAVLNDTLVFGALLAVYFLLGLATLALFLMVRENSEQRPAFGGALPAATANIDEAMSWPMARQLLRMALATLALMGALFVITPRTSGNAWEQIMEGPRKSVGFEGSRISLGDNEDISENAAEVLRARLYHYDTHAEYILVEPLLLRGSVLTNYDAKAGKASWSAPTGEADRLSIRTADRAQLTGHVEQEFIIRPLDDDTLFSAFPFYKVSSSDRIEYDTRRERLCRPFRSMAGEYRYNLVSPSFKGGRQSRLLPDQAPVRLDLAQLEPDQQSSLPGLIAAANEAVRDIPAEKLQERAEALELHLRDSGRFTYSMQQLAPLDPLLDPLENFVTRSKSGHCEYFASALVLMLRSQGIPARIVMGFKTTDYNNLGHFFQVRQLHAHAWAEAYIPELGGWWRLDPTPSAEESDKTVDAKRGLPTLREIADFVRFLWSGYVVGLNASKQREEIYKPVLAAIRGIFSAQAWRQFFSDARVMLGGSPTVASGATDDEHSTAGILSLCVSALVVGVYRLIRRLPRLHWPGRKRRTVSAAPRRRRELVSPVVAFYRRFETLLERSKFVRPTGQTQREFAREVGGKLADRMDSRPAASAPRVVVDAFYRVRFGGQALDNAELEGVEKALLSLEQALSPPARSK